MAGLYDPSAIDTFLAGLGPLGVLGLAILIAMFLFGVWLIVDTAITYGASRLTTTATHSAPPVPTTPPPAADVDRSLSPRDQSNATALAPTWWKRCWNAHHRVAIRGVNAWRIEFVCRDCDRGTFALYGRSKAVLIERVEES